MLRFLIPLGIFALISCSKEEKTIIADSLRKESDHFFSNNRRQDHFILQFIPSGSTADYSEYTYHDILSGNLMLTVYDSTSAPLYSHKWAVSDCFSMADNHYLNEDEKIEKFRNTFSQFFDANKFGSIGEFQITGILKSSDSTYRREIERDPGSIGFSFIQEDFCVMYARKSRQAVLLRALKKDLLNRYNLLNEPANISLEQ